jgi:hypothetical protein
MHLTKHVNSFTEHNILKYKRTVRVRFDDRLPMETFYLKYITYGYVGLLLLLIFFL